LRNNPSFCWISDDLKKKSQLFSTWINAYIAHHYIKRKKDQERNYRVK
jgi:hypothetical protein